MPGKQTIGQKAVWDKTHAKPQHGKRDKFGPPVPPPTNQACKMTQAGVDAQTKAARKAGLTPKVGADLPYEQGGLLRKA